MCSTRSVSADGQRSGDGTKGDADFTSIRTFRVRSPTCAFSTALLSSSASRPAGCRLAKNAACAAGRRMLSWPNFKAPTMCTCMIAPCVHQSDACELHEGNRPHRMGRKLCANLHFFCLVRIARRRTDHNPIRTGVVNLSSAVKKNKTAAFRITETTTTMRRKLCQRPLLLCSASCLSAYHVGEP